MAELSGSRDAVSEAKVANARAEQPADEACCEAMALAVCCDPSAKEDCCGDAAAEQPPASCGCRGGDVTARG